MARALNRLNARQVATLTKTGYHADGGGLYLRVAPDTKAWAFRFRRHGRLREMGLGPVHSLSLAQAREAAADARRVVLAGADPIESRKAARAAEAGIPTFEAAAAAYIAEHRGSWKNPKHADQWGNTLEAYAYPTLGRMRVDQIDTPDVLAVLKPIWSEKTETATRVRQRIEAVLDAAAANKQRNAENPARWRGNLAKLLPKPEKLKRVKHFPAMPFADLPNFLKLLRARPGNDARALEYLILTASRTGMVVTAHRDEIEGDTWKVPAERMKAGREHVVPLVPAARALLKGQPEAGFIFPGGRGKPHLSTGAMDALLERMGFDQFTVHGFRSTFKDWAAETTTFPNIVSEAALAHTIGDKVEAAYRRGALLKKRRELMAAWAKFCGY
ncbi:integrase arm-type DNA-binding domain-containing protein [Pseudoxanthomonas sp. LjRoot143]|uniref:tyrosine-type recombinase/integrase n=1 Tax=Pseudoxanthomonas sp. LjRoot143 TaxID=3342266 RepID=UPI003ED07E0B